MTSNAKKKSYFSGKFQGSFQIHLVEWKRMTSERDHIAAGDPGESIAMQEIQKVPTAAPGVENVYLRVRVFR